MIRLQILSFVVGVSLIVAGVGDYAGHLWGRQSPHPVWAPLFFILLGFLLLFPDRLGVAVGYAKDLVPWLRKRDP